MLADAKQLEALVTKATVTRDVRDVKAAWDALNLALADSPDTALPFVHRLIEEKLTDTRGA